MLSEQENSKRIAKNTGYLYLRMILVVIINLITSRLVLRALGYEDYGTYSIVGSLVILFSFISIAFKTASVRYISYEIGRGAEGDVSKVFSMVVNCHAILAAVTWLLLEIVGLWFINYHLQVSPERLVAANWVFQFSLLTVCTHILQMPFDANIVAHERMNFYALISIVEAVLKLSIAVFLLYCLWDKLIVYGALLWIAALLTMAGYVLYSRQKITDCHYQRVWDKRLIRQFAGYSGWTLYVNAADMANMEGRAVLFNLFLNVVANAALGLANQVYYAITMFMSSFSTAFNPQIVKSYAEGNHSYFERLIYSSSKLSFYLLLLPGLPLLLNIEYVLHLWLGDYPPITDKFIWAMFLYAVFDSFQAPLWHAVMATGQIRTHQIMMGSIKLLVLPAAWWLLKNGDNGVGAILIWGIANIMCAIVRTIYCKHLFGLNIASYLKQVVLPIVAVSLIAIPVPVALTCYMNIGWPALLTTTAISTLMLAAAVYGVGLNHEEKVLVRGFIR